MSESPIDAPTPTPQTPLEISQHLEILELESQIRSLNTKISAAVDHAADLQDEIRQMRQRRREEVAAAAQAAQVASDAVANESGLRRMSTYFSKRSTTPITSVPAIPSTAPGSGSGGAGAGGEGGKRVGIPRSQSMSPTKPSSFRDLVSGSMSSFSGSVSAMSAGVGVGTVGGGSVTNLVSPIGTRPSRLIGTDGNNESQDYETLLSQLSAERQRREESEEKYRQLQLESEELSGTLFEEANKMVSVERRLTYAADQKLEAAKERERERGRRLVALEGAVDTIRRARQVLDAPVFV